MTAPVSFYTTYADVRAALGVTPEELEDATIELGLYSDNLEVELEEIDTGLAGVYVTTKALASPTSTQDKFLQAVRLFSTYAIAKHLTSTVTLFAPKDITDGKAAVARIADPYKTVKADVIAQYDRFRTRLTSLFAQVNSTEAATGATKVYFGVVSPDSDPVTGT